jgi:hypothetical protein
MITLAILSKDSFIEVIGADEHSMIAGPVYASRYNFSMTLADRFDGSITCDQITDCVFLRHCYIPSQNNHP